MTTLGIELVDAGIAVARDEVLLPESPGYALLHPEGLRFGQDAVANERLFPRRIQNRFWDRLEFDALSSPHPQARTQADLAHGHLRCVLANAGGSCDAALLAVPGSLGTRQLGILLGIAESCQLPVTGMVDAAVAACAAARLSGRALHVDLLLHRAVVTHLEGDGSSLRRTAVETSAGVGRVALYAAWAECIALHFVRHTRFEPLHDAASEQQLYDLLPGCLRTLKSHESAELSVQAGSRTHAVRVTRDALAAAAQRFFAPLASQLAASQIGDELPPIFLSARLAHLPGLEAIASGRTDASVEMLPAGAAALGALAHAPQIRSEPGRIELVTQLSAPDAAAPVSRAPAGVRPTHLLAGDRAFRLVPGTIFVTAPADAGRLGISSAPPNAPCVSIVTSPDGVFVEPGAAPLTHNGAPIRERRPLQAGDRLRVGDGELQLIGEVTGDGT